MNSVRFWGTRGSLPVALTSAEAAQIATGVIAAVSTAISTQPHRANRTSAHAMPIAASEPTVPGATGE